MGKKGRRQQESPFIPTSPVPTRILTMTVPMANGKKCVQMSVSTPLGVLSVFLEPDATDLIADNLKDAAREARTDIVIPTNGHVVDINDRREGD